MPTTIEIPDFQFAAFYYAELLDALITYKRQNVPEHTDETPYDPLMQFIRMQALVGHLNNCLLDMVANESTLPTSALPETVRNMLRLIDYEMATASPSGVELVFELSKVFAASFELIPERAAQATESSEDVAEVPFEVLEALTISRTDQMTHVFAYDEGTDTYTDYTTEANSPTTPADDFTPWAAPAAGDCLYIGHDSVMWNQLGVWFTEGAHGDPAEGEIQFIVQAQIVDGETFVLDDGTNPAVTFHFNQSGTYTPIGGYDDTNIEVDISGDTTDQECALTAQAAINGATALNITASAPVAGLLGLTNDMNGSAGNVPITETVADGGFAVDGMADGIDDIVGVWEYYDGNWAKSSPDEIQNYAPNQLLVDLTSLLGTVDRTGTTVRIQLDSTVASEDVVSAFGIPVGSGWTENKNYILTTTWLGQTTPSTEEDDYTVGSDWTEVPEESDGTDELQGSGDLEFRLPQLLTENWSKGIINSQEDYWLRFRIISAGAGMTVPVFQYMRIDQGQQYTKADAVQGRTQVDAPLGSSDGTANQSFETTQDYYIDGTMSVLVDGDEWTEVDNFLSSRPLDEHYRVILGEDDRAEIVFGDGTQGKIPPVGVGNIEATYRYGANNDGNVGAMTITTDLTGLSYVRQLANPRPATGWSEAEGATEESLELAKILGPASLRAKTVAVGPGDVETMALTYTDENGSSPFSRARAFEEGFGPKTIELTLVVAGGQQATAAQLAAIGEYFNGDVYSYPPKVKRVVANQEVVPTNFTPKTINIAATVYGDVTAAAIENRLAQIIQPEALKADGVSYEWSFGGKVTSSRIAHEIFEVDESITDVDITEINGVSPPSDMDVQLAPRELPELGTVTLTIVS